MIRDKDKEQTAKTKSVIRDAMGEMRDEDSLERVVRECDTMEDLVRRVCEQFNGMRSELSAFLRICKDFGNKSPRFAETLKAVTHGDYGNLLSKYRAEKSRQFTVSIRNVTDDVEEAGGFASVVERIMNMVKPETRMLACIDVNDRLSEAIASWQSKIDKMRFRSKSAGSSVAEIEMAEKSVVKFGHVIEVLKKRGGQVSDIYLDAQRQLDAFQRDCKEKFKVIYFNPKA